VDYVIKHAKIVYVFLIKIKKTSVMENVVYAASLVEPVYAID
jgi:hypothetical protein